MHMFTENTSSKRKSVFAYIYINIRVATTSIVFEKTKYSFEKTKYSN